MKNSDHHQSTHYATDLVTWIKDLHAWCDQADDIARHYFDSSSLQVEIKTDESPVTIADQEIEKTLVREIKAKYPHLPILGEESEALKSESGLETMAMTPSKKGDMKLIIDPIDATRNFVRSIPYVGTLIGLEKDGEVVAGMVSSPIRKDRWWAAKGKGAFAIYNGHTQSRPIKTSSINKLGDCLALHASLFGSESGKHNDQMFKLLSKTPRQRGFGDFYNHMVVATGQADFAIDFGLKPWDVAPLKIIVEEAGGRLTSLNGKDTIYESNIVSSNNHLHSDILAHFQQAVT